MASELLPNTAPEPAYRTPWQKWVYFWFPAADPTTLGFVRVTTGLLVLYIHLAYSVDLQQFFGKQGWYSAAFVDRERHEYPWQVAPFWEWDPQSVIPAKVPDFPHRRTAVVEWIRGLPADEAKRAASLRFLDRVAKTDAPDTAIAALRWFQNIGTAEEVRERYLAALVAGPTTNPAATPAASFYTQRTPPFLLTLPPAEREQVAADVRAFWATLPADDTAREYVINHVTEVPPEVRRAVRAVPTRAAARRRGAEGEDRLPRLLEQPT